MEFLNITSGLGCRVSRIKNGATYDPATHQFRASTTEKGIPDLIGVSKGGLGIYIEVKNPTNTKPSNISKEQKLYLRDMETRTPLVGIAYEIGDAFDIVANDPALYPRKQRTYNHRETPAKPKKVKKIKLDPVQEMLLRSKGI